MVDKVLGAFLLAMTGAAIGSLVYELFKAIGRARANRPCVHQWEPVGVGFDPVTGLGWVKERCRRCDVGQGVAMEGFGGRR